MKAQKYSNLEIVDGSEIEAHENSQSTPPNRLTSNPANPYLYLGVAVIAIMTVVNLAVLLVDRKSSSGKYQTTETSSAVTSFTASKIAFGSCSSYDLRQMHVWTDAIVPSAPDAWIWAGDMVYLDDNEVNCAIFETSAEWQQSCNCSASWLLKPPYTCHAGDVEYANQRWITALNNGEVV